MLIWWCVTKMANSTRVRYDQVNAMLLNEFLKEHRKIRGTSKQQIKQCSRHNSKSRQRKSKR